MCYYARPAAGTIASEEEKMVHRQATRRYVVEQTIYSYKVQQWLDGDPAMPHAAWGAV